MNPPLLSIGRFLGVAILVCSCGDDDNAKPPSKKSPSTNAKTATAAGATAPAKKTNGPNLAGSNWKGIYTIVPYEVPFGGGSSGSGGGSGGGSDSGTPSLPPVPELPRSGLVAAVGNTESVRATIEVIGDSMIVTTSRPAGGTAHRLTGTLRSDGNFRLTDSFDGEIWSSYEGPASPNHVILLDFVNPPSSANPRPNLYKMDLRR
jgi:hypothetical protein